MYFDARAAKLLQPGQHLVVPEFSNGDVYPLMTHLLRITAAPNDGDYEAVKGMLVPAAR